MKKTPILFCLTVLLLLSNSCSVDIAPDPQIHGLWRDLNTRYFFGTDRTYYIKYLRQGTVGDSILNDSIFGTYQIDRNRNNLTFEVIGYVRRKDQQVINHRKNGTTWQYEIKNQDTLHYISNTSLGKLYRQK